ncbi:MAG: hypothetical protein WC141_07930 [Arcobacteraceae bacterium]
MKVTFKAHIEENGIGGWVIRISNTQTKEEALCKDLEEFSTQIELLGQPYKDNIEVLWSKADNLTEEHFYEVKQGMAKINKELHEND